MEIREQILKALEEMRSIGQLPETLLKAMSLNSAEELPATLKGAYESLKGQINAVLAKMPTTDQVPAALDAGYALNHIRAMMSHVAEVAGLVKAQFLALQSVANTQTSLNSRVSELEGQLESGELLTKAQATELANQAAANAGPAAVGAYQAEQGRRTARLQVLNTHGIPETAVPEAVFGAEDEAFDVAITQAAERKQALEGKGMTLAVCGLLVAPALFDDAAYKLAETFATESLPQLAAKPAPAAATNLFADPKVGKPTQPARRYSIG
ncbi:MAG: hypothetical protein ACYDC1_06275 [Limisphaerales bacterium]